MVLREMARPPAKPGRSLESHQGGVGSGAGYVLSDVTGADGHRRGCRCQAVTFRRRRAPKGRMMYTAITR